MKLISPKAFKLATPAIAILLAGAAPRWAMAETKIPPIEIPGDNKEGADRPDFMAAEAMARTVADAIVTSKVEIAQNAFFPADAFVALKDMFEPEKYYIGLRKMFLDDIHKQNAKISDPSLLFSSFKPGFCKWKAVGSEYNRIPYWSCYRSKILLQSPKTKSSIEIRVMINWGKQWYITHLGSAS